MVIICVTSGFYTGMTIRSSIHLEPRQTEQDDEQFAYVIIVIDNQRPPLRGVWNNRGGQLILAT